MMNIKTKNIKIMFNKVSYKYDFFNNLFSFGLHKIWKNKLINSLTPNKGEVWADLCCGTGDMTFLLSDRILPHGSVMGIDNSEQLLKIARNRSKASNNKVIIWEKKDIFDLDNKTLQFNGICMSYGLRNLRNVKEALNKVFLLLDSNGRAGFLDFNHSNEKSFSTIFQKLYLRFIVVPIAGIFNLSEEYRYIEKSIKEFPKGNQLIEIAKIIGFKKAKYKTLFGGQMGLLILEK